MCWPLHRRYGGFLGVLLRERQPLGSLYLSMPPTPSLERCPLHFFFSFHGAMHTAKFTFSAQYTQFKISPNFQAAFIQRDTDLRGDDGHECPSSWMGLSPPMKNPEIFVLNVNLFFFFSETDKLN